MRKVRAAALILMLLGFAGLWAAVADDPAENLRMIYIFGGIGCCGCAIMGASGIAVICGLAVKRLKADQNKQ